MIVETERLRRGLGECWEMRPAILQQILRPVPIWVTLSDGAEEVAVLLKERVAALFRGDCGVQTVPGDDERVIGKGGQLLQGVH